MPRRIPTRPPAAALLLAISLAACSGGGTPTVADALPLALAVRSDTPYLIGTIVSRSTGRGGLPVVRVRAAAGAPLTSHARESADVTVHPDSLLVWRDGRAARPSSLVVGRAVTVWVRGPELESLPPQVTASAILLER